MPINVFIKMKKLYVYCNFTDKEVSYDASILNNEKVLIQNYNQHQKGILKPYESIVFYQKAEIKHLLLH